jgi:hypothetical protein
MPDKNLARALLFMLIALVFGLGSLRYSIGQLNQAGPGLFPLMVSGLLFLICLISLVQSRFVKAAALDFNLKNIAIVLASLCGFALLSQYLNVVAGIVFLVFFSSYAASSRSVLRNLKVSAGLLAVTYALHKLLGLSLPF